MITRRELRQQAMRQGVALGALEKDYICGYSNAAGEVEGGGGKGGKGKP